MKFLKLALVMTVISAMTVPASAQETWKSIGKGLFRENFIHTYYVINQFPEVEVEIEESEQTPGRYRLVNPYKNYPIHIGNPSCYEGDWYMIVDASDPDHCFVETDRVGYQIGKDEMLIVSSVAYGYKTRYGNWDLADKENVCGKLVDGSITFPPKALLVSFWNINDPWSPDQIFRKCDDMGMFRVKLPGAPDLDITAKLDGINNEKTELSYYITLGKSIERAKVALIEGSNSEGAVEKIVSGEISSMEITDDCYVKFPYSGDGSFTLVVVPYWEGTPRTPSFYTHEIAYNEDEWRKAGTAFYREGIVSGVREMIPYGFVYPTYEYYVEVEENTQTPGLIRLVDPYGPVCPLSQGCVYDSTKHWYLVIDATDPNQVVIKKMEGTGLNLGYGVNEIWSYADRARVDDSFWGYGLTDKEIADENWFGMFTDNQITFPNNSLNFQFIDVRPGAWYAANSKGEFLIRFEEGQIKGKQSGIESINISNNDETIRYYRLDGTQVADKNLTPGIYIVKQGEKSYKKVIR